MLVLNYSSSLLNQLFAVSFIHVRAPGLGEELEYMGWEGLREGLRFCCWGEATIKLDESFAEQLLWGHPQACDPSPLLCK